LKIETKKLKKKEEEKKFNKLCLCACDHAVVSVQRTSCHTVVGIHTPACVHVVRNLRKMFKKKFTKKEAPSLQPARC